MKRIVLLLIMAVLALGLFAQEEQDVFVKEYKIGPKDLLEIAVFELPELNQTVRVSEDGSISLPLLGQVVIEGMAKDSVEKKLASLLEEKYLKKARVTVFIREYQSQRVAVIGAVGTPGMYELIGRTTVLQLISKAGGLTDRASNEMFVLREARNGVRERIAIDLDDLINNGNQDLDIPLQANDTVNIPIDQLINIFVFGEVRNPGALQVRMSKRTTLLQAIAQAGGPTEGAARGSVTIKRKDLKSGKEVKMKVNLKDVINGKRPDIELREGDVVFVPESIF
jgi:polysaccharide biosynthesis/export protein